MPGLGFPQCGRDVDCFFCHAVVGSRPPKKTRRKPFACFSIMSGHAPEKDKSVPRRVAAHCPAFITL
jgi:hypothetical protein